MFGKVLAGVLMGIIAAPLATTVVSLGTAGGEGDGHIGLWAAFGGFLITLGLAVTAERGRYAWGRGLLICCLLCFALPLAGWLFTGIVDGQGFAKVQQAVDPGGATIGTVLSGFVIAFLSDYVGVFMGVIFLIGSYFTLRRASQNWPNPTRGG